MSWHRKVEGAEDEEEEDEDDFVVEDARTTTERGFAATTVVVEEMFEDVAADVTATAPNTLAGVPKTTSVSDVDGITSLLSIWNSSPTYKSERSGLTTSHPLTKERIWFPKARESKKV